MGNQIDPVRVGEELLHRVFYDVFHHQGARRALGFSRISAFCDDEGLPGWHLWFDSDQGAYQIFTIQAEVLGQAEAARVAGRFGIRYFPARDDFTLADYSAEEIRLRGGPHFDHTGTPTPEGMEAMDEGFFLAGFLDYRTDLARRSLEFSCTAPDRWREARRESPGTLCRNAPGWGPAVGLFDRLVNGVCHVHHTAPELAVAGRGECAGGADLGGESGVLLLDMALHRLAVGFRLRPDAQAPVFSDVRQRLVDDGFGPVRDIREGQGHEWDGWWTVKDRIFGGGEPELCTCYQDH